MVSYVFATLESSRVAWIRQRGKWTLVLSRYELGLLRYNRVQIDLVTLANIHSHILICNDHNDDLASCLSSR